MKINLCILIYFFILTKKTKLKKHRKYLAHCEAQPILACSLKYLQLKQSKYCSILPYKRI